MKISVIVKLAGGPTHLARQLGIKHTSVLGWRQVPPTRAREVARLAGLHPSQVRPDLYDLPSAPVISESLPDSPKPALPGVA